MEGWLVCTNGLSPPWQLLRFEFASKYINPMGKGLQKHSVLRLLIVQIVGRSLWKLSISSWAVTT